MTDRQDYTRVRESWRAARDNALCSTAATIIMNNLNREREVSDRTDTTRRIGAYEALVALTTVEDGLYRLHDGIIIGELLGRAVAIARERGVTIPVRSVETTAPEDMQLSAERVLCALDEVDFPIPGLDIE